MCDIFVALTFRFSHESCRAVLAFSGLMIRLAWHCNGSYREFDGRGGCDGGRIRFDPEINWPDNANLDKALQLLAPIKEKYGSSLSWGDLIVLAGNTAIESMGFPKLPFCGGRVDDADGSDSLILGPSDAQEELTPCVSIGQQGMCDSPLGPTTMGLIYVNPEGPVSDPDNPVSSGLDIREAFSRMGFNDTETVALVGGGHAFGKAHAACPDPPCGEGAMRGIGNNTFTSGLEGAWTPQPTTWTNLYFQNMLNLEWEIGTGPGGHQQWAPTNSDLDIIMLTTDLALRDDPTYLPISQLFAENITALEEQFAAAWYRLTTADMGPPERCINDKPEEIPPAQWWQQPLPNMMLAIEVDYIGARSKIQALIDEDSNNIAAFANLAHRCAATFRVTDHKGGCNGARIRFAPESEWPENAGTADALATLEAVKDEIPGISYADLIVLAGQTAIETAGGIEMDFCGGRVDATDGLGSMDALAPRYYNDTAQVLLVRDDMQVKGLSAKEGVALFARPKNSDEVLSNEYFVQLLAGEGEYDEYEMALLEEEFLPIVEEFAGDDSKFKVIFRSAWTKMMTADRYDGPVGNVCTDRIDPTLQRDAPVDVEDGEEMVSDVSREGDEGFRSLNSGNPSMRSDLVVGLFLGALTLCLL